MSESNDENKHRFSLKESFMNWIGLFLVIIASLAVFILCQNLGQIFKGVMYFFHLIKPVVYGAVIAYLVNPCYMWVDRKLKLLFKDRLSGLRKGISITLGLLFVLSIVVILCMLVLPQLFDSVIKVTNNLPTWVENYYFTFRQKVSNNPHLAAQIQALLLQLTDYADTQMNTKIIPWLQSELLPNVNMYAKILADGVIGVLGVLYNLLIGIIVSIYLLCSKEQFLAQSKKIIYGVFNHHQAEVILHYISFTNKMFSGFITGKIVDSTIIGILCFILMSIFNMPYAILVSTVVGVTNVIPVFGPYIGAIPSVFFILLISPIQALYFVILIIVLQQLDGNIIGPAILGESTGLSAFWVLFSILLFGGMWGIMGMVVGVPLFAVIYRIIADFIDAKLSKKQLSPQTEHYMNLKTIQKQDGAYVYVPFSEEELEHSFSDRAEGFFAKIRKRDVESEKTKDTETVFEKESEKTSNSTKQKKDKS